MATYRVLAAGVNLPRDNGPNTTAERPHTQSGAFTDSDEFPTLVEIDEHCTADLDFLLALGAIALYTPPGPSTPPAPVAATTRKGATDG